MIDVKNLSRRMLFAGPAIPLGWWFIHSTLSLTPKQFPQMYPGQLLCLVLTVAASFEYSKMLSSMFPKNAFWLSSLWLISVLLLEQFDSAIPLRYAIFLLLMIVAGEAILFGDKNTGRWKRASLLFSGVVFLDIAGTSLINMYQPLFQSFYINYKSISPMLSQLGITSIVGAAFFCDSAAYFGGSLFGKHKFSSISPNKTIEGAIAGFLVAFITCAVTWYFFGASQYPRYLGIIMGVFIGVFAQIGDLFVSLMKRYFKVKNASDLLPGHGGVLDRFGSVFFAVPSLGLFFWVVKKIVG